MLITFGCYLPFPPPSPSFTPLVRAHTQVSTVGGFLETWDRKEANQTAGVPVHQHLLGSPIVNWGQSSSGRYVFPPNSGKSMDQILPPSIIPDVYGNASLPLIPD